MHGDKAAGIASRDGLAQFDLGETQIVRRNRTEHVGCHHAHRGASKNLFSERATPIAEQYPILVFLDDKKIATDTALQIDQGIGYLSAIELLGSQRRPVMPVNLFTDALPNDAYEPARILDTDDFFQNSRKFTNQRAKKMSRSNGMDF